jgi:hypothetical protein
VTGSRLEIKTDLNLNTDLSKDGRTNFGGSSGKIGDNPLNVIEIVLGNDLIFGLGVWWGVWRGRELDSGVKHSLESSAVHRGSHSFSVLIETDLLKIHGDEILNFSIGQWGVKLGFD